MKRVVSPRLRRIIRQRWKEVTIKGGLVLAALLFVVQIFYPSDRLLPFAVIDKQPVGMMTKNDAARLLDERYSKQPILVYLGKDARPKISPKLSDLGIGVENRERIEKINYPLYTRIIPTSLLWAQFISGTGEPKFSSSSRVDSYVDTHLMSSCSEKPRDATVKSENNKLIVVPSDNGGECERQGVIDTLKAVRPRLGADNRVQIALKELPPKISNKAAEGYRDKILARLGSSVPITVRDISMQIPADELIRWMEFSAQDKDIVMTLSTEKSAGYLAQNITPKVSIAAGVTRIVTRDFTEVSRSEGAVGQTLDVAKTLTSLVDYVTSKSDKSQAIIALVPPRQEFTRSYSPTDAGLSALLANYAKDHKGTFGISLVELSGKRRRANYNGDQQFTTASTYKLFVAYSVLRRMEAGTWSWNDQISGGRNAAQCFDDMIVRSDNACAEVFLQRVGLRTETEEMNALGLKNSTFLKGDTPLTTANDLAVFLGSLEAGQSLAGESRSKLINAMTRNIYRQGIPAGASGTVADKVGFLGSLFHDAAIVYSPSGTYVLVVMSDGSDWATIADLTRQVENLRKQ